MQFNMTSTILILAASPLLALAAPPSLTDSSAALACAISQPCNSIQTAWKTYTAGGADGYAIRLWSGLCYNDAGPPTHSFSGNLVECAQCIDGPSGTVSSHIPSFFRMIDNNALCGPPTPDLSRLQNWTHWIFDFGRSKNFPIDLPFGTACTGDSSDLPWPNLPAAKRDVEADNIYNVLNNATNPTKHAENDNHESVATIGQTPARYEDCLNLPVCQAAKRTFDFCINRGELSNACFCIAGAPWTNNAFECASCVAPFLKKTQTGHGPHTFPNATLHTASGFCATRLQAAELLKLGEVLTITYGSPIEFFNITKSSGHV